MDQHVHEWAAAVKSKLRPGTPGRPATMQPGDIDELICALKQHGLWGDFTLSPDNGDISYRLHAALQLLLQDVSSKRAIAWWERWRRGEPSHNNDLDNRRHAIRSWVTATCQTIADAATRNMDAIHRFRYAQETSQRYLVNDFLARCLHMLWEEEHAIAKSFLVP
ncbi:hypothetical protein LPJ81_001421 [Coemansia sp. IMI 209127]|nr:hypothetical protein LPJ81_001421 [Coemansia sp. IMI 209127]